MNSPKTLGAWPLFDSELEPVATTSVGLILLGTDRVSHDDARAYLPADVAMYSTRIPMSVVATPETLRAMERHLAFGAEVLVPGGPLDAVGFSCTSGTVSIGTDVVRERIQSVLPGIPVVTPVEAAAVALRAFGAQRIALLVPYLEGPADLIHGFISGHGFDIVARGTFGLPGDPEMNRVGRATIFNAAEQLLASTGDIDALFISCTGLFTSSVVDALEQHLGLPVVTSNQAQAWQLLRRAGRADSYNGFGKLFTLAG